MRSGTGIPLKLAAIAISVLITVLSCGRKDQDSAKQATVSVQQKSDTDGLFVKT